MCLVLSRQRDERIMIGHDIIITITEIRGDKVRLAITAPKDVLVYRQEIYNRLFPEKAAPRPEHKVVRAWDR
jgi:carbon storage regulator